jgi:hypothetical protein
MSEYLGDFVGTETLVFLLNTYGASNESITLSGLAVTDIEIYKGSSMTQRSSDAGYTLLDTDGIDLDGVTGIHGFSVDLSNNTDAGFFSAGSDYFVVLSAVTVNSQTVNKIAGRFSIQNRFPYKFPVGTIPSLGIVDSGTAQAGAAGSITLRAAYSSANDIVNGRTAYIYTGTGAGQSAVIYDYDNTTKIASTSPNWVTNPDNTSGYILYPSPVAPTNSASLAQVTVADILTAALAKFFSQNSGTTYASAVAGSVVKEISDNAAGSGLDAAQTRAALGMASANMDTQFSTLQSDTNDIQTRLPAALVSGRMDVSVGAMAANVMTAAAAAADLATELQSGLATAAALTTLAGYVDTEVAAILAAVDTEIATLTTNLATVNSTVNSVLAMLDDPRAEPGQGAPAVNADAMTKLDYLYKAWRNRSTLTSSEYKLYADNATTVDHKSAVSDDTTTYVRGEIATGP